MVKNVNCYWLLCTIGTFFFIVIWLRLFKTVRSFCRSNVLLYFSFILKTLSRSEEREREWNIRKIESDVVFVISLVIWWTAFQYIYWIALISNVYLFKLRVLSFIAHIVVSFVFFSYHSAAFIPLKIFFFQWIDWFYRLPPFNSSYYILPLLYIPFFVFFFIIFSIREIKKLCEFHVTTKIAQDKTCRHVYHKHTVSVGKETINFANINEICTLFYLNIYQFFITIASWWTEIPFLSHW